MLKATFRYLVILLVACLAALALYWVVENRASSLGLNTALGRGGGRHAMAGAEGGFLDQRPANAEASLEGFSRMEHGRGGEVNLLGGLSGVLKNVTVIAAITLIVFAIRQAGNLIFQRRRVKAV